MVVYIQGALVGCAAAVIASAFYEVGFSVVNSILVGLVLFAVLIVVPLFWGRPD